MFVILELNLNYRSLSHMANCTVMKIFTFFIAPLMLNITEETEASISDDEFVVNPLDTDSTWDTFETSKSASVIQMIVNIPLILMDFFNNTKKKVIISQDIFHQHTLRYVELSRIFANTEYFCETQRCQ
jgi:hypothetical protein